jgi:hypothetical protein
MSNQYESLCSLSAGFTNLAAIGVQGWNCSAQSANICTGPIWTGVTCDLNLNIVSIDIAGLGIQGTISSSLSGLTSLYYLGLNDNDLTGTLPAALGNL